MVRSFTCSPISEHALDQIIRSGHAGPSAGNTRSLELLVLTGEDVANYWDTTLTADARETFPWPGLPAAPVLIVPYVDPAAYVARYSEPDKARTGLGEAAEAWTVPYWWVDGGAAVENMLLAAGSLGLGACFFGQFEHEAAVRVRFGVPANRRAVGTIAIGYRDPSTDRPSKSAGRPKRPSSQTTHHGLWQES